MEFSNEVFTPEEKKILSFYVSNTDRSVFVLTNLPEVIKGALFSRYSRSTLGLRSLLLRDFIQEKNSKFSEIQAGTENLAKRMLVLNCDQPQLLLVAIFLLKNILKKQKY